MKKIRTLIAGMLLVGLGAAVAPATASATGPCPGAQKAAIATLTDAVTGTYAYSGPGLSRMKTFFVSAPEDPFEPGFWSQHIYGKTKADWIIKDVTYTVTFSPVPVTTTINGRVVDARIAAFEPQNDQPDAVVSQVIVCTKAA